jgi:hypothetical protein
MRRLLPAMTWVGCVGFLIAPAKVSAQTDFDAFWLRFKTALINDNKPAVADLTRFPLLTPFGTMSVKSRNAFLDHYDQVVNMEANARRCFQQAKPENDGRGYSVYCTFKGLPESSNNRPIRYYFGNGDSGWRLEGIDNINE